MLPVATLSLAAASATPAAAARPLPGFWLLAALLALLAAAKAILFDTLDPDGFLHLLAADQLLRDGIGPIVDRQSFASVQTPWTPYSWLGALGMKAVWDLGGYRAAVAAHAVMAAGVVTLVALSCRAAGTLDGTPRYPASAAPAPSAGGDDDAAVSAGFEKLNAFASIAATAVASLLILPFLSFRPLTLAILILALITFLLLRDRRLGERSGAVWWTVPLVALGINVHPLAAVAAAWAAMLLAGALHEWWRVAGPPDWIEAGRRVRRYEFLFAGTLLACLATPMLPGMIRAVIQLQIDDTAVAVGALSEHRPFYHGPAGAVAATAVAVVLLTLIAGRRRLRAAEMCWLLLATALLFRTGRFSPFFALSVAPFFAAVLPRLNDRVLARPAVCALLAIVLGAAAWRVGAAFPRATRSIDAWANRHGPDAPGFPCAAADFVERHVRPGGTTGRIVNEYAWGGYLQWRFVGRFQTLLDGRTNLYTRDFWRATYLGGEDARRNFLANVHADVAVLPRERSAFRASLVDLGWRTVYLDDRAEVLVPPPPGVNVENKNEWGRLATLLFSE